MAAPREAVLEDEALDRLDRIGGAKLVTRMIETFLDFAPGKVRAVRLGVDEADYITAGDAAHALKSSSGNVGATRLFELAFQTEKAGRADDAEALGPLADELEDEFEAVCNALRSRLGAG